MRLRRCIFVAVLGVTAFALSTHSSPTFFGQVLADWNYVWRYEPSETNLAPHPWTQPEYDDSTWISGQGLFAFPLSEPLPPGRTNLTMLPHHIERTTHYFRTKFQWDRPETVYLTFSNLIDDGAVFYLNGAEIQRVRMPTGVVSSSTLASAPSEAAFGYDVFVIENPPLIQGANTLAVEVHQRPLSGDVVFGSYVRADQARPPCGWMPTIRRDLTLLACSSTNLTVPVDGFPKPALQWYKNGQPIPGATNATHSLTNIGGFDQGTYVCTESHTFGSCDLGVFTITVIVDDGWLLVEQAVGLLDLTQIRVRFNMPVDPITAGDPFVYHLRDAEVQSAMLSDDPREVLLTTTPRTRGQFYDLELYGILSAPRDCGGVVALPYARVRIDLETVVLPFESVWHYNDWGIDLGTGWRELQYDDLSWPSGLALLGFEGTQATLEALEAQGLHVLTPLQIALGSGDAIVTHYFRKLIDIPFVPHHPFTLQHVVDDGAVFYVNGAEAGRFNMLDGVVINSTVAPTTLPEGVIRSLPVSGFTQGTNILAVEVHQAARVPGDVLFGAQLIGIVSGAEAPRLHIARDVQTGALTLSWPGRATLEQSATMPPQWSRSANQSNPQTISASAASAFYRLRQ